MVKPLSHSYEYCSRMNAGTADSHYNNTVGIREKYRYIQIIDVSSYD